ncbi:hypothetical protein ACMYR3_09470 [Ampullimonas aquatilis]|uniref:hypothetical protein n=1 Tax=Ampullimonas aquatilis TaxID=1341549 RepID=UPI003C78A86F
MGSISCFINRQLASLLFFLMGSWSVFGHEVLNQIEQSMAVVVTLTYADGEPFSYEIYELYAEGAGQPSQKGRTDLKGRLAFVPDDVVHWHLRAFSEDGHGVDLHFDAQPNTQLGTGFRQQANVNTDMHFNTNVGSRQAGRVWRLVTGFAMIALLAIVLLGYRRYVRSGQKSP